MICPNCYCEPCKCTNGYSNSNNGTTNYCIQCNELQKKIDKAIAILKDHHLSTHKKPILALEVLEPDALEPFTEEEWTNIRKEKEKK